LRIQEIAEPLHSFASALSRKLAGDRATGPQPANVRPVEGFVDDIKIGAKSSREHHAFRDKLIQKLMPIIGISQHGIGALLMFSMAI
jgi:hypothetical protein